MPSFVPLLSFLVSGMAAAGAAASTPVSPGGSFPSRGLVIVLRPIDVEADELTRTALARVTGELTAARFQVTVLPLDPNLDPTPQLESVAPESEPVAAFAIARVADANRDTIAIWVSDRLGRRTTISRMAMRGDNVSQDAAVLAIEAIELIRVSIAGLWPSPARSVTPDPTAAGASAHPIPGTGNDIDVSLGLGIAMLRDIGISSPQWMASLGAMVMWPGGLAARAQLNGLGSALTLSGDYGTATAQRQLAMVGLAWVFWREERVQSLVSVALGVEHLDVEGAAPDAARAHSATAWSAFGLAGIGAAVQLGGRISLATEVDLMATPSPVNVRIANTETKAFLQPGVLVNMGLHVGF